MKLNLFSRKNIIKGYLISSFVGVGIYVLTIFFVFIFSPRGDGLEIIKSTIGLPNTIALSILRNYYGTLTSGYLLHGFILATIFYASFGALVYTIYLIFCYVKTKIKQGK